MQTPEEFAYEWGVSEMHQESIAKAIRSRDAEIRRECADRAIKFLDSNFYSWSLDELRAAITGEEE